MKESKVTNISSSFSFLLPQIVINLVNHSILLESNVIFPGFFNMEHQVDNMLTNRLRAKLLSFLCYNISRLQEITEV